MSYPDNQQKDTRQTEQEEKLLKLYQLFLQHPVICTDSRKVTPDSIFFSLKGEYFDGNRFAAQALDAGCLYAVVDDPKYILNDRYFLVPDVLHTLQRMACHHRKKFNIPVLAITGTNGKTTTKELCHAILASKFNTVATSGNLNNQIGVPLTLLSVKHDTEIVIIEMGANHQGEIASLCQIAIPTHGMITNIGKAHMEGFGGFEGVVKAKKELYDYFQNTGNVIFYNSDNVLLGKLSAGLERIAYGSSAHSSTSGEVITTDPFLIVHLKIKNTLTHSVESVEIRTHLIGHYNFENILAAACIGNFFTVSPSKIQKAIEQYHASNNRSQVVQTRRNTLIMDAYNANPSSMEQALINFANMSWQNKVLIIGDMLELGDESQAEHDKILDLIRELGYKTVFLVGEQFSIKGKAYTCFTNTSDAREYFRQHPVVAATILIKGSRGIGLEKLTDLF
jgi:UDP-N-acetylmuramoyl-tripeptide--D-alanyl-D-alanine ligase